MPARKCRSFPGVVLFVALYPRVLSSFRRERAYLEEKTFFYPLCLVDCAGGFESHPEGY